MKSKMIFLYIAMTMSVCVAAQSARNPLNRMPADISVNRKVSSEKLSETVFYRSDGTPFDRSCFAYDGEGRKMTELVQRWNESENQWRNVQKEAYSRSDNAVVTETFEWVVSEWVSRSKSETFYDAAKKRNYSLTYLRDTKNDAWNVQPSSRVEWKYDKNGCAVEYLKQFYNSATNDWETPNIRILYTCNSDGDLTEELYQERNPETGLWMDGGKYTYSAENGNRKIATSLIPANGKWIADGEIVSESDEDGNFLRSDYYGSTDRKSRGAYCLYIYSGKTEEKDGAEEAFAVNAYPNPAVDILEIVVPETLVGAKITMYDAAGKQVKAFTARNRIEKIDVSGLSRGIYFLKTGNVSRKVVVK